MQHEQKVLERMRKTSSLFICAFLMVKVVGKTRPYMDAFKIMKIAAGVPLG